MTATALAIIAVLLVSVGWAWGRAGFNEAIDDADRLESENLALRGVIDRVASIENGSSHEHE